MSCRLCAAVIRDRPEQLLEEFTRNKYIGLDDLSKALRTAATYGRGECARILLEKGALPDLHNEHGFTPLSIAAKFGHSNVIRLLVRQKCKVNKATFRNRVTALHWAATYGHISCIRVLLAAGCDPMATTVLGRTPLMLAARSGQEEALEEMLDTGCDPNQCDFEKASALHLAAEEGSIGCVRLLLNAGAKLDEPCKTSETPLMLAAKRGQRPVLRLLKGNGADVNKTGRCMTALHWAADCGSASCVEDLVGWMGDPDVPTKDSFHGSTFTVSRGVTPLMLACRNGHLDVVKVLIAFDCKLEKHDEDMMTPLTIAVQKGHSDCVEYLLQHGANPEGLELKGVPCGPCPLFMAVEQNSVPCVRALLRANCNLYATGELKGGDPIFAFDLALTKGYLDVVRMFVSVGYDLTLSDPGHLQESLSWLLQEDEDFFHKLLQQLQSPIPLMQLCRRTIRDVLGKGVWQRIQLLPLPPAVKNFLNLSDLDY